MLTFSLAVFLLIISPGPGVLSLAGVGAVSGWRPGINYLIGLFLGNNIVCIAVISGVAAVIMADELARAVLLILTSTYLGHLAFKIAFAETRTAVIQKTMPGIFSGTTFQLINPKAYAVNLTLFSGFAFYPDSLFIETGFKLLITNMIWIPLHFLWLFAGVRINSLELSKNTQRVVNLAMAGCLISVIVMSNWSVFR